ncbi:MAG: GT-D fold domain-containing protein [Smithellaceae bacterium]
MKHDRYLDELIRNKAFYFNRLYIADIDNEPMVKIFSESILEQETCLFASGVTSGDEYCSLLHQHILNALQKKQPLPIVRFADGEYAFYNYSLNCNGLYKQAESVHTIRDAMPQHINAIKYIAAHGLLAPLVFPGNVHKKPEGFLSFLRKKPETSAADFLDLLAKNNICLTPDNYLPFYVLYAYLTSDSFASAMDGKKICILNSEYNKESCRNWFSARSSSPQLHHVPVPAEYVATRWSDIRRDILAEIPADTDLCLVGAGVGALLICSDTAKQFSIPAIDAGHVINMMNEQVYKSGAIRLYTIRKV